LALMAFDVVVCKLKVGPSAPLGETRERRFEDENDLIHQVKIAPLKTLIESPMNSTLVVRATRDWLLKEGLRFKEVFHSLKAENRAGTLFIAGRHGFQRWGDFFLHISIVVILAGSLLGAMFGFEEILPIAEGETVQMKNRPYEVTLDDFDIEYYRSTGAPSLYASKITVKEKGAVIGRKRIIVNDPLDIDRVRFYQASWGMTTEFRSATLVLAGREFHLGPKHIVQIPGTTLSVRANQFLPSFDINELGQPVTMDYQGVNPAVQMDFFKDNRLQVRLWLLKRNPEMSLRFREGRLEKTSPPPFRLMEVDPVLFSGIQVGYDPGAPVFWLGSITLLIGLGVHFYFHQRRIKILILPDKTRSMIWVGGWNSRTPEDFQNEFKKWTSDLKKLVL
jgi:cytochrome c biogenesis protein